MSKQDGHHKEAVIIQQVLQVQPCYYQDPIVCWSHHKCKSEAKVWGEASTGGYGDGTRGYTGQTMLPIWVYGQKASV